jgi:hypothetical protein
VLVVLLLLLCRSLQTTLSLMWPPEKIAATAVFLAHEMHGLALPSQDGKGFCQLANITDEELRGEWRRWSSGVFVKNTTPPERVAVLTNVDSTTAGLQLACSLLTAQQRGL